MLDPATNGIFPAQWIRQAIADGVIQASPAIPDRQIQPNSLDLRLSDHGHRVRCSFLPGAEGIVRKFQRLKSYDIALDDRGFVLETNRVYIFPLCERLHLPLNVSARANPKSSTGRLDVFTRVITETGAAFDEVPAGYSGALYLEIVPRSFAIRVRPGDTLAQIRFQTGQPGLGDEETRRLLDEHHTVIGPDGRTLRSRDLRVAQGVFLSVRLSARDETIGYRARKNSHPIDLQAIGAAPIRQFWERLYYRPSQPIILEPDEFYIFASRELVSLPHDFCAEMVPFDAGSGELRTHYAGFFDSGFGFSEGRPAYETAAAVVLEVRSRDVPFLIEDGHPLFRLLMMRNTERPDALYGSGIGSNYQSQRLRLSKQFSTGAEADDEEAARAQPHLFSAELLGEAGR